MSDQRAGLDVLRVDRIDDLLTADERAGMTADLAEMARRRRRAEAEAAWLPMA